MDFEQWVKDTPKPLVAAIFLAVFIFVWVFVLNPPHTICDTQKENLKENQKGVLFAMRDKKKGYLPVVVQTARESCFHGNSAGACYEYFDIMKRLASAIKNTASECYAEIGGISIEKYFSTPECAPETKEGECDMRAHRINVVGMSYQNATLRQIVADAIKVMVFKAWGEQPPEMGPLRLGWFSEAEIAVFCHLKDVYTAMSGEEDMQILRKSTFEQLPGPRPLIEPGAASGTPQLTLPASRALDTLSEQEVFQRSLFSVRCDNFR